MRARLLQIEIIKCRTGFLQQSLPQGNSEVGHFSTEPIFFAHTAFFTEYSRPNLDLHCTFAPHECIRLSQTFYHRRTLRCRK